MIRIGACGALNSVQDLGRFGFRNAGVSTAGPMDIIAHQIANVLCSNPSEAASLEVQTFPFSVQFIRRTRFAITGASCAATLSGQSIPPWWTGIAAPDEELVLHPPHRGARAYLAMAGGIDVPLVLGSRSTDLRAGFGGLGGRAVQRGDIIPTLPSADDMMDELEEAAILPPEAEYAAPPGPPWHTERARALTVRVIAAPEYDLLDCVQRRRFASTEWTISSQSNRTGFRLLGPPLVLPESGDMASYGLVAGLIQLPPSGLPMIQLSDAKTAGGYPRLGTVIEADLWRIGQAPLGSRIKFALVDHAEALRAQAEVTKYLHKVSLDYRQCRELMRALPLTRSPTRGAPQCGS